MSDLLGLALTVLATGLVVLVILLLVPRLLRAVTRRGGVLYEQSPWRHLPGTLWPLAVMLGLWAAAVQWPVPEDMAERYQHHVAMVASALLTVLVVYALLRVLNAAMEQYRLRLVALRDHRAGYLGVVRKLGNLVLAFIGLMLILEQLGYQIGPLMASLGVAGIAVALALQDTLGGFFSGIYLSFDQPIRPGDYIQLDTGVEGFVEQIGWRATRLRPWQNNIIVVPNKKLAEATITNWYLPEPAMSVYVWCGVGYGSDLEHVERVCCEVGDQVMRSIGGGSSTWDTVVRFKEFGDSNIKFVITTRVSDPTATYLMQHELIKALHRRFREEGIEIAWPVRQVVFPQGPPAAG